jgi:hypothetical protein
MNAATVALLAFGCASGAALLGLLLRARLPPHHLDGKSRDGVKRVLGLVATTAALVLGLLVSSAQDAYNTQRQELRLFAAGVVVLDRVLRQYGPGAEEARRLLREGVAAEAGLVWTADGGVRPADLGPQPGRRNPLEAFHGRLQALAPATDAQRLDLAQAIGIGASIVRTRMLMLEQLGGSLPPPFLAVLALWLSMLFLGFGLTARPNATVAAAMLVGAASVSGALFLLLELDRPYDGLMRLSDEPLRAALAALGEE